MRNITQSKQFGRDCKKVSRSGRYSLADLELVIEMLSKDISLPPKYRDHQLTGEWNGFRECHIKPDWLLIYEKQQKISEKILFLVRTGSHSELFE